MRSTNRKICSDFIVPLTYVHLWQLWLVCSVLLLALGQIETFEIYKIMTHSQLLHITFGGGEGGRGWVNRLKISFFPLIFRSERRIDTFCKS